MKCLIIQKHVKGKKIKDVSKISFKNAIFPCNDKSLNYKNHSIYRYIDHKTRVRIRG